MEELKATLKSCIISRKGGIPIQELNNDYKELVGDSIPFKKMGYSTVEGLLKSIDGITLRLGIVHATSANTSHIEKLISKQKTVIKKQNFKLKKVFNKVQSHYDRRETKCYNRPYYNYDKNNNVAKSYNQKNVNRESKYNKENDYNNKLYKSRNNYIPRCDKIVKKEYDSRSHRSCGGSDPESDVSLPNIDSIDYYEDFETYKSFYLQQFETFKLALWLGIVHMQDRKEARIRDGGYFNGDSVWVNALRQDWRIMRAHNFNPIIIDNHQVMGDDFMIHMTNRGDEEEYIRGPCVSGLTLKKAQIATLEYMCIDNVLICCGTIDVHMNLSLNTLITDMQQLLLCLVLSGRTPVVCNIPPTTYERFNETIRLFNNWLSSLTFLKIIDLHSLFMCPRRNTVRKEMFQREPIYVNYCRPVFLWSRMGVSEVKHCITRGLSRINHY